MTRRKTSNETLRAACVALMVGVLVVLWLREGAAQQESRPPMPPNLFTIHKLTDRLSIISPYGPDMSMVGGNVGVFITDEGVLVVDDNYYTQVRGGQTVALAQAVLDQIRKMTDRPIRYVINTHHHGDHAGGNPIFSKVATIYAQKNVRDRILSGFRAQKAPPPFDPLSAAPTVTYDGELIFHLGGEEIHLYHPGRAHTDGDSIVHISRTPTSRIGAMRSPTTGCR